MRDAEKKINEGRYHKPIVKFFAIVCLAVSIFLGYISYEKSRLWDHLQDNGKIAEGVILNKSSARRSNGYKGSKGTKSYNITYVFTPDLLPHDEIRRSAGVSQKDYIQLELNQTIKVNYAPMDNRIVSRLTNYETNDTIIGIGMSVLYMIAFLYLLKRKSPIKVTE